MDYPSIAAVDYHAGGEPFRIVTDVPAIAGATVADKRVTAISDPGVDGLRALLCSEPRGHADMYGGFVVPPDDDGAHFGVLFWHKDGVSVPSLPRLIGLSREIKGFLNPTSYAGHPLDGRLSGIYGVIYFDDEGTGPDGTLRQRNVTVFADGEVDRSPCGSGTASRVAALHAAGRLRPGQVLAHSSISGATWLARADSVTRAAGRDAVLPVVTGRAYQTGEHRFTVDPDDDMVPGFVLR
jgi:proline racemase